MAKRALQCPGTTTDPIQSGSCARLGRVDIGTLGHSDVSQAQHQAPDCRRDSCIPPFPKPLPTPRKGAPCLGSPLSPFLGALSEAHGAGHLPDADQQSWTRRGWQPPRARNEGSAFMGGPRIDASGQGWRHPESTHPPGWGEVVPPHCPAAGVRRGLSSLALLIRGHQGSESGVLCCTPHFPTSAYLSRGQAPLSWAFTRLVQCTEIFF